MTTKKTVILKAPTLTQSGYGTHSRQCAKWLLSRSDLDIRFVLTPWGNTSWVLDRNKFDGLAGSVMDRSVSPDQLNSKPDVSLQLVLPNEWDTNLAKINVGVTAGVETDKCNPSWIESCNKMHSVIVPSEHTKFSFQNTGNVNVPIHVIPESYVEACVSAKRVELPSFNTSFNFLVFGQLTGNNPNNDRKNTFNTIKWLSEVFKDDKDVGIVLKTNVGKNTKIDRGLVNNMMTALLQEVRKSSFPKLHLVHGDMSDEEVVSLYRHPQIKALVSLTRGEGYGLPILEAAACDVPIIATGWSGHMDFLKHGKFVNISYQLQQVHPSRLDKNIFMKNARWAEPSEEDFKKRVAKFRNSCEVPKQWAVELGSKIREQYSFDKIKQHYESVLSGVV